MKTLWLCLFLATTLFVKGADSTFYFTTTDGVELFVRIAGKGDPCLFVHGGPGSTSAYFEATHAAPLLQRHMQMIYFDQRGSGRSRGNAQADYSMKRVLKDMEELRAHLGISKWMVMGHSFGGVLITNYAYHYPAAVSSLIMLNGTVNVPYSLNSHIRFGIAELKLTDPKYTDEKTSSMERLQMVHSQLTEAGVWHKLMFRNAFEKRWSDSVTNAVADFNYTYGSRVMKMEEYHRNYAPLTKLIKSPVLVITGTKDFAIGVDHYRSFQFPQQKVVHYYGGHCPFQEEPQWFAEKVIDFATAHK